MVNQAASKVRVRPATSEFKRPSSAPATSPALAIPELQLLRAVGCLLVFSAHSTLIVFPWIFAHSPQRSYGQYFLRALYGFFIISGIVLTLPFVGDRQKTFSAKKFYSSRFLRLYPMYWGSLLFALAVRFATAVFVSLPGTTPWAERFWTIPLTPATLLPEFSGVLDSGGMLFPGYWTFALEVQICLLFPLILLLVRRTRHWTVALIVIMGMFVATHYFGGYTFLLRPLGYFVVGGYLAKYNQLLKRWLQNLPRPVAWAAFLVFVAYMALAPAAWPSYRVALLLFDVFLALLMVMVQVWAPLVAMSRLRPVQRMADLSFSFYLVHLPVLTVCAYGLEPRLGSPLLSILAALSVSLVIAWIGWRWLETPVRAWYARLGTAERQFHALAESRESAAS